MTLETFITSQLIGNQEDLMNELIESRRRCREMTLEQRLGVIDESEFVRDVNLSTINSRLAEALRSQPGSIVNNIRNEQLVQRLCIRLGLPVSRELRAIRVLSRNI